MSAHETQHAVEGAIEEMCQHLQKHCHETVPAQIGRSLAAMAKEELAIVLQPLDSETAGAITAGFARYSAAQMSSEARRCENVGRVVEERLAQSSPKERQAVSDWKNGGSLAEFKRGR